jgi:hypothetical protein
MLLFIVLQVWKQISGQRKNEQDVVGKVLTSTILPYLQFAPQSETTKIKNREGKESEKA